MAIALDLVVDSHADTLCDGVGLDHDHVYKDEPKACPECRCVRFRSYELLGSLPEPIIWECKKCQSRFPKFKLNIMEELLREVSDLWTNPEDWSVISRKDYN